MYRVNRYSCILCDNTHDLTPAPSKHFMSQRIREADVVANLASLAQAEKERLERVAKEREARLANRAIITYHAVPPPQVHAVVNRGSGMGKGKGKGGVMKRHKKVLRQNIMGITKPAIRRLARQGGVKRISGLMYEEVRDTLKEFLQDIIGTSIMYAGARLGRDLISEPKNIHKPATVTALDVLYALKKRGRTLYGFEGPVSVR